MGKDGGPAFPRAASEYTKQGTLAEGNDAIREQDGMSLRDYFAAAALQGMLAADSSHSGPRWSGAGTDERYQRGGGKWLDPAGVSRQAYEIADAMLEARKK